jgi:hypothetical protein
LDICHDVSPALLIGEYDVYCQKALVGESGMIKTQMWKHNRSVIVAVYGTPCAIPSRKSNVNMQFVFVIDLLLFCMSVKRGLSH